MPTQKHKDYAEVQEKVAHFHAAYHRAVYFRCHDARQSGTLDARCRRRHGRCGVDDNRHHLRVDDDAGSFFFLWRHGGKEERDFHHPAKFHGHGAYQRGVGSGRFQPLLWRRHWWRHRQSPHLPDVPGRGRTDPSPVGSHDTVGTLRPVPDEVCHHHPFAHHRLLCRACEVLGLSGVHGALLPLHLLSAGPLHVASRGLVPPVGRGGLCRRHCGSRLVGCGRFGRSHLPGAQGAQGTFRRAGQHPLCGAGCRHAVAGMVRVQCRVVAPCRCHCGEGVSQHQYSLCHCHAHLDILRHRDGSQGFGHGGFGGSCGRSGGHHAFCGICQCGAELFHCLHHHHHLQLRLSLERPFTPA